MKPLMGFELTTDQLWGRGTTHCATLSLSTSLTVYILQLIIIILCA